MQFFENIYVKRTVEQCYNICHDILRFMFNRQHARQSISKVNTNSCIEYSRCETGFVIGSGRREDTSRTQSASQN